MNTLQITLSIQADATPLLRDLVEGGFGDQKARDIITETAKQNLEGVIQRACSPLQVKITSTATL